MNIVLVRRKIVSAVMYLPREWNRRKLQKRLKNKTPTIIACDCIGGIIYHDLGLRFNSPMINLWMQKEDFIALVRDLKGYLNAELIEERGEKVDYPVGSLTHKQKKIYVYFMHYNTFEQAKKKWEERKRRVDFNNIYIIQNILHATDKDIACFDSLPYKNKMLITSQNPTGSKNISVCSLYLRESAQTSNILNYRSRFSSKRWLEEINYVEFINRPQ